MAYISSSNSSGTSTTPAVTVPAGAAIGDIVIMCVTVDDQTRTFNTHWPTSFVNMVDQALTFDGQKVGFAYKRLTAADTGTYTFASSMGGSSAYSTMAFLFRGRDATNNPVASTGNIVNTGANSPVTANANGLTALAGDDLLWL